MKTQNGGRVTSPQGTFPDWDWFWWDKGQATSNRMSLGRLFVFFKHTNSGIYSHHTVEMSVWRVWASVLNITTCRFGFYKVANFTQSGSGLGVSLYLQLIFSIYMQIYSMYPTLYLGFWPYNTFYGGLPSVQPLQDHTTTLSYRCIAILGRQGTARSADAE